MKGDDSASLVWRSVGIFLSVSRSYKSDHDTISELMEMQQGTWPGNLTTIYNLLQFEGVTFSAESLYLNLKMNVFKKLSHLPTMCLKPNGCSTVAPGNVFLFSSTSDSI